ncbi:MAG TPA: hypothetical protein VFU48_12015, partial [Nitrospira sp.]|nr:hypothetical protein [Nitrospira sp.]
MLLQEVRYELCTETSKGFNPHPRIVGPYKTLAEGEEALAKWRYLYPNENTFLVRTMMVRISNRKRKGPGRLKAV